MTRHASETNSKKVDEAGEEFLDELLRHFHCARSAPSTIPCRASGVRAPVAPAPSGGDEFTSRLLKYFHHDVTFVEDVLVRCYEQTENAA